MDSQRRTYPGAGAAFATASQTEWRKRVQIALKGAPFDRLIARTLDDIAIGPLHGPRRDAPALAQAATPGWTIFSRIDHPDAAAANAQALADVEGGAGGLHLTLAGASSAFGFGLRGASDGQSVRETLRAALAGVDPARTALALDMPFSSARAAGELADIVADSGLAPAQARICFGLDPFDSLLREGAQRDIFTHAGEEAVALATTLADRGFSGPALVADARALHAAGASEAQELAFLTGAAVGYLRLFEAQGVEPDRARRAIGFRIAADCDQFPTIARMRALRRLMARVEDACGLAPAPIHIHAETAWRMMTRHDPWMNAARATIAVFAAATGGADAITVLPHSQPAGLPDGQARRLARNIQLVLAEEARIDAVTDPGRGAGGIEALTDALCAKAWALFQSHEARGGLAEAIRAGDVGEATTRARTRRAQDAATARAPITGVSAFPDPDAEPAPVLEPPPPGWSDMLAPPFRPWRPSEAFEDLRLEMERRDAGELRPSVFLATLGPAPSHVARANFARNFLAAGGFGVSGGEPYETAERAVDAFRASGSAIACLCASDDIYAQSGDVCAGALKQAGAVRVLVCGRPQDGAQRLREAGVDDFLFAGADMPDALQGLAQALASHTSAASPHGRATGKA